MFCSNYINNKKQNFLGYKYFFDDLYGKLNNLTYNLNIKLQIETVTSDFEIALYKEFLETFNKEDSKIRHIGCYYHYMYNVNKNLGSLVILILCYKDADIKYRTNNSLKILIDYLIKILNIKVNKSHIFLLTQ